MQAAHVKEAEAAFKEAFRLHDAKKSGSTIWKMYAHMKQVRYAIRKQQSKLDCSC